MNNTKIFFWRLAKTGYGTLATQPDGNPMAYRSEYYTDEGFDRVYFKDLELPDDFKMILKEGTIHRVYGNPKIIPNQKVWIFSHKGQRTKEFIRPCNLWD